MATAIKIEALPARLGDCLLVECRRPGERPWRMLIDGGPPDTWPILEARLKKLPAASRQIDVAIVTHVDSDHIGGFIPFVQSDFARDHVRDFWFNGRQHLPTPDERSRSITQGESLGSELTGIGGVRPLPWNLAFEGGPVESGEEDGFVEVEVPDGPRITVLSPTRKRLSTLAKKWFDALAEARRTTRPLPEPDVVEPIGDLVALAAERSPKDGSAPNGSSIALLVEHRGASVILSGDAFGNVLEAGLKDLITARGVDTLEVDAFKVPHHGSRGNVSEAMLALAPAEHYVFSSNGDTFHHPDDVAVARTILAAPPGATLWFNYRNPRTERWDDPALRETHDYRVRFPEDAAAGAVLELPAKT